MKVEILSSWENTDDGTVEFDVVVGDVEGRGSCSAAPIHRGRRPSRRSSLAAAVLWPAFTNRYGPCRPKEQTKGLTMKTPNSTSREI